MYKDRTVVGHISVIIHFLNEQADYAVLRNYQGLPDKNTSRDIDIIITRKSYHAIKSRLVEIIDRSGWKIITFLNSDRLITYVCALNNGDRIEIVQWDFFFNTSVFGILLMDAMEFLEYKRFNGELYYVDIECEFLDKYLYNRAVGKQYPKKYCTLREFAEHSQIVEEKLKQIYGVSMVEACDKISGKKLLFKAILSNLKGNPFTLFSSCLYFLYNFISNYICSNTGFSVGFTGCDGSGKTTIINSVIERFGDVFGEAYCYYHFRPSLFGNLGEVATSVGIKKNVDHEYEKPHRGGKTGIPNSLLRLFYYSIDYVIGYFVKVKSVTRITRLVFFDRYYTDIICDSRRSRIFLNHKFLYWYGKLFIPSLDYNILLTADIDTILTRKQELDAGGIRAINEKIEYLAGKKGYKKILNESTPEKAVTEILSYIFESQHRKNLLRLK